MNSDNITSNLIHDAYSNEDLNDLYENRFKWTPSMTEWRNIKEDFKKEFGDHSIVLFQMGKFYETYFHDAHIFSKLMNITLTKKNKSDPDSAPMSWVNIDFASSKMDRLAGFGLYVIVVSELDEKNENWQFIRVVEKIITPGTCASDNESRWTNVICSVDRNGENVVFWMLDIFTSSLKRVKCNISDDALIYSILSEFQPKEFILSSDDLLNTVSAWQKKMPKYEDVTYSGPIVWNNMTEYETILGYATRIIKNTDLVKYIRISDIDYDGSSCRNEMVLDSVTIENLEILKTSNWDTSYSLLNYINRTSTSVWNRLLKSVLLHPLTSVEWIIERQNSILEISKLWISRSEIFHSLISMFDIDRIATKISNNTILPSDYLLLKASILEMRKIKSFISSKVHDIRLLELANDIDDFTYLLTLINESFLDNPSNLIKEGNIFKYWYSDDLDNYINLTTRKKEFLDDYAQKKSLETWLNVWIIENTQWIFLEVNAKTLAQLNKVSFEDLGNSRNPQNDVIPKDWFRVRGTKVYERFTTQELIDFHKESLVAEVKRNVLEYSLYSSLRIKTADYIPLIQKSANAIAWIDILFWMSEFVSEKNWTMPAINDTKNIVIINGSHPIIESLIWYDKYVRNNAILSDKSFKLLTWPNMGWKSVYLKSIGIITILAQIWMPIPASHAEIWIVDNVFVRAWASDNFVKGHSTFYLEMFELSNIMRKSTKKSLVLLDEIGRGTDTSDWEAIAASACEYFIGSETRTVFASHYHELIESITWFPTAGNTYVEVLKNSNNELCFTHKIIEWNPPDKNSYGIEIAKMAWLPNSVIDRAFELKKRL